MRPNHQWPLWDETFSGEDSAIEAEGLRTKGGHRVKYLEVSKSLGRTSDTESNEPELHKLFETSKYFTRCTPHLLVPV